MKVTESSLEVYNESHKKIIIKYVSMQVIEWAP